METDLTIQLRVLTAGMEKLTQAQSQVSGLDSALSKASSGGFQKFAKTLESTGSRINVLGQRIMFMAGLPLLAFGNNAVNTAVEVERSFVRLQKVFSGTAEEFGKIRGVATKLSSEFGKPVEDVTQIITEFNKAGVNSIDDLETLGKVVAQTAILFDTDLTKATEGTKAVMFGFNLTAADTVKALAAINIIGDKTTASEQGVLDVFNRAAGTARQLGFSYRELAASEAVFEKNAIPAGRAGNAMKSILTSLIKQSDKAKGQFLAFGVDMDGLAWRTSNAGSKLDVLAKTLLKVKESGNKAKLTDLNEAFASLVGKFQINNLNVLLEDLGANLDNNADSISQFGQAMAVSADETENLRFQNQQLEKVMASSPQKLDILNQMYRNQMVILGNELLPIKMKLLEVMTKLIEKYNQLTPAQKDWIVKIGIAVVILGPFLAALGLVVSTLGFLLSGLGYVARFLIGSFSVAMRGATLLANLFKLALASLPLTLVITIGVGSIIAAVKEALKLKAAMDSLKGANENAAKSIDNLIKAAQKLDKNDPKRKKMLESAAASANQVVGVQQQLINDLSWKSLLGFASGGIIPGNYSQSTPVIAHGSEMVLNPSQQANLFKMISGRGQGSQSGAQVNINVGTMIATRGEQRNFARMVEELMNENDKRLSPA